MSNSGTKATPSCQVLVEQVPQSGAWNMALDEALLEFAANEGQFWLRWYRWAEPTVSLGYFQREPIPDHLRDLPTVRRLSGGGAILHHHEWTYSVALPASHPLARQPSELYVVVHDRIVATLSEFGLSAQRRGAESAFVDQSFLCFQRGDANDIVIGSQKILGSAQRRRRGAVLQHGSLLLQRSQHAPEIAGICDLGGDNVPLAGLAEALTWSVSRGLGGGDVVDEVPNAIKEMAEKLKSDRYQSGGPPRRGGIG